MRGHKIESVTFRDGAEDGGNGKDILICRPVKFFIGRGRLEDYDI